MVQLNSNVVYISDAEWETTRLIEFDTTIEECKREAIATLTANYIQKVNNKVEEEVVNAVVIIGESYVKIHLTINDLLPFAASELNAVADGLVEEVKGII